MKRSHPIRDTVRTTISPTAQRQGKAYALCKQEKKMLRTDKTKRVNAATAVADY